MDETEHDARPKDVIALGEKLDTLSIEELEKRITLFEAEIARLRRAVAEKRQSQAAAESFFKAGG